MNNLILVFERNLPPVTELRSALSAFVSVERQSGQVIVCEHGECVFIQPDDEPASWWFQSWPMNLRPTEPKVLVIAYRDLSLAKRVVIALAQRFPFVVNTDAEEVYRSDDFARRCAREPTWDWLGEAWTSVIPEARRRPA